MIINSYAVYKYNFVALPLHWLYGFTIFGTKIHLLGKTSSIKALIKVISDILNTISPNLTTTTKIEKSVLSL